MLEDIVAAEGLADYRLHLRFEDGVDHGDYLSAFRAQGQANADFVAAPRHEKRDDAVTVRPLPTARPARRKVRTASPSCAPAAARRERPSENR